MRIRKGVIILVYYANQFLLVKQRNNSWSLPSGGIEENEQPVDAAKRELYEETGIQAQDMREADIINEFFYDTDTKGQQQGFICEATNIDIPGTVLTDEILDTKWVTKDDAKQYLLKPNQYEVFCMIVECI